MIRNFLKKLVFATTALSAVFMMSSCKEDEDDKGIDQSIYLDASEVVGKTAYQVDDNSELLAVFQNDGILKIASFFNEDGYFFTDNYSYTCDGKIVRTSKEGGIFLVERMSQPYLIACSFEGYVDIDLPSDGIYVDPQNLKGKTFKVTDSEGNVGSWVINNDGTFKETRVYADSQVDVVENSGSWKIDHNRLNCVYKWENETEIIDFVFVKDGSKIGMYVVTKLGYFSNVDFDTKLAELSVKKPVSK